MAICMNLKQGLLFRSTPEYAMMKDAAEKAMHAMHAMHAPTRPTVVPPPRRTMHLTGDQIKALEEYRKFNTYLSSKEYTDLHYLNDV